MRRTAITVMCLTVAMVFTASCNNDENIISVKSNGRTVINCVAEAVGGGTRAHNQYSYDVLWDENDKIWVTDGSVYDTFTLVSGGGTNKGKFSEDNSHGISGNIEALYPASLHTESGDYVWPAVQTNDQVAPMYARQSIGNAVDEIVGFSSLGGMLQIVFNSITSDITVTSITLKDNRNPLSGKFTVDESGQAIIDEDAENIGITLDLGSGVAMGNSAKYFNIAIPAGKYSQNDQSEVMTITFRDDVHHKECVMTSTSFPAIARNTVGRITLAGSFQMQECTVRFDMSGREGTAPTDMNVIWGNTFDAPVPTAANSVFMCWCQDAECTTPYDITKVVTADMTLYAKWTNGINGHAYVELAGYKWATENVEEWSGVKDVTIPAYLPGNDWKCYFYNLNNALDAAQRWGSDGSYKWTLPSKAQWSALINNCFMQWTSSYKYFASPYNGRQGFIVYEAQAETDKGKWDAIEAPSAEYSMAVPHIFLPAAGTYNRETGLVDYQGDEGYYWASDGSHLDFNEVYIFIRTENLPYLMSVRPVAE